MNEIKKKLSEVLNEFIYFILIVIARDFLFDSFMLVLSSFDTSCHGQKGIIYKLT